MSDKLIRMLKAMPSTYDLYPHRNIRCMACDSLHKVSEMVEKPSQSAPGYNVRCCPKCGNDGYRMASPTGRPILKRTLWHYAYRNLEKTSN